MAPACCPKWGKTLKDNFRRHIDTHCINPEKTDKASILCIRDCYYKDRPDAMFIKNYNTSVTEWCIGHYMNEYNKKKCEF
jgi:hypothetical protein